MALAILTGGGCAKEESPTGHLPDASYVLVFDESFEGTTLNASSWTTWSSNPKPYDRLAPRTSCDFSNSEIFLDRNVTVKDGLLILTAQKEDYLYTGLVDGTCGDVHACGFAACDSFAIPLRYTSGSVFSTQGYRYGYVECRARIPSAKGLYPVFWMWHHDEIVVFEFFGNDRYHYVSLHHQDTAITEKFNKVPVYSDDFHLWAVEWTPFCVSWLFDGQVLKRSYRYLDPLTGQGVEESHYSESEMYAINPAFPEGEDRMMHLNLSLHVYEWSQMIDEDRLPDRFLVDYVRVYQKME